MPFCCSLRSLSKSTFARVVGFGIWFGLPELVDATSVNSETARPFPLFGSLLGVIVPVIVWVFGTAEATAAPMAAKAITAPRAQIRCFRMHSLLVFALPSAILRCAQI